MSRGAGRHQRAILDQLAREPTRRLPWDELKRRFPKEVEQRTFYRAVRGLRHRGLVYDQRGGRRSYLALTVMGDEELRGLCNTVFAMFEAVARARGVPVPPTAGLTPPSREPQRTGGRRPDVGT